MALTNSCARERDSRTLSSVRGAVRSSLPQSGREWQGMGAADRGDSQRLVPVPWAKGVKCARGWSMSRSDRQAVRICALHTNSSPGS